jgi:Membrane MotB of proton-channel complex MotA/MotB
MSLFGHKKKHGPHEEHTNSLAWMVSYADMATILLAMFIVLSSFSKDQTGLTLYKGTGSFDKATNSFGLPGLMPNSARMIWMSDSGPAFAFSQPSEWKKNEQPDAASAERVIDDEEERFQHFLDEIGHAVPLDKLPRSLGQASVDLFEPLDRNAPYLKEIHRKNILPLLPLLRRKEIQIQVVVWAPMPVESAQIRSSTQATRIVEALAADARLTPDERSRLVGVGQCWRYRDVRRPIISFVVTRTE